MQGSFHDTNVLLYLISKDPTKADRAEALLADGGTISVQVLNEFASVARRKLRLPWNELHALLTSIRGLLTVVPLTIETHERALALAERYRFSIYDSLLVAAALHAGCDTLWSEDMQHNQRIDTLRIANPFRDEP